VRVGGVQEPPRLGVRAALDHLPDQLDAEPPPAVLGQDVDVGQVDEVRVADRTSEADLPPEPADDDETDF
jgi:hypothetical protein